MDFANPQLTCQTVDDTNNKFLQSITRTEASNAAGGRRP